jgi:hypothetical protein
MQLLYQQQQLGKGREEPTPPSMAKDNLLVFNNIVW